MRPPNNEFSTYTSLASDGDGGKTFKIDHHSGLIDTVALFDREKQAVYNNFILWRPSTTALRRKLAPHKCMHVFLQDVNEYGPTFESADPLGSVFAENEPPGTSVLVVLSAVDADLLPNTYAIVGEVNTKTST